MPLDAHDLAAFLTEETGLPLTGRSGLDADKNRYILVEPAGHAGPHGFAVRITLKWRRLEIAFEPGKFASELLGGMAAADPDGRSLFESVVAECIGTGATVALKINGADADYRATAVWPDEWVRFTFGIGKGNLEIGAEDGADDNRIVREWSARFLAAVVALLPLEPEDNGEPDVSGYPEGSLIRIEVNRYERDRRNRSAALAIHGRSCKGCGMSFERTYGDIAAGFIEVHHTTPVSVMGPDYRMNVQEDLFPLCSNCHSVVHRRTPSLSLDELIALIEARRAIAD